MSVDSRRLVNSGLLVALSLILARFSITVPIAGIRGLVISPGAIPVILAGFMYGPVAGGVVGAIGDIVGFMLFPQGTFFPGFTLSAALSGALPALIRGMIVARKGKDTIGALAVSIGISRIVVSVLLNTLWLNIMFGRALAALLPPRLIAQVFTIPFFTVAIYVIERALGKAMGYKYR